MASVATPQECRVAACVKPTVSEETIMAEPTVLKVGDSAPPIEAETSSLGHFSLEDQRGKWVVIYFYPRANTPG